MDLRPDEISAILKEQIAHYEPQLSMQDVGTVVSVGDGICHIYGLTDCMAGELLDCGGVYGMAQNLERLDDQQPVSYTHLTLPTKLEV